VVSRNKLSYFIHILRVLFKTKICTQFAISTLFLPFFGKNESLSRKVKDNKKPSKNNALLA
jgi:hypothetical protein